MSLFWTHVLGGQTGFENPSYVDDFGRYMRLLGSPNRCSERQMADDMYKTW